ncbi:MAG: hypothetical protein JWP81_3260 [Ferruginibacter sp.]|nr:hypothetical protein [Ferruginibacter sp.]
MGKVSIPTRYLSNKNYIQEVSVEGKKSSKFYFRFSIYELYVAQIIRAGNCITLLSSPFEITRDNFWNTHYFEDITRHVFWTFNKSFVLVLMDKIETLSPSILNRCYELLIHNFQPYDDRPGEDDPDEELQWCIIKNRNLIRDEKFKKMYLLDQQNRKILLEALDRRKTLLNGSADEKNGSVASVDFTSTQEVNTSFIEVLYPMNGNAEETLQFIIQKTAEANFEFNIFSQVKRFPNGKNQYGLNGSIAAAIDFFYQLGYYKKDYNLEQIFKAYSLHTRNTIGKLKVFLSEFRQDNSYLKHIAKLKELKIDRQL